MNLRLLSRLALPSLFCLAVGICLALGISPVLADDFDREGGSDGLAKATFVLRSGETLTDVLFEVEERFKIVTLVIGGEDRNVSFADIAGIYRNEKDITPSILGRPALIVQPPSSPEPDVPTATNPTDQNPAPDSTSQKADEIWLSQQDARYQQRNRPLWHLGIRLGGNYTQPFGEYYEGMGGGLGYGADLLVGLKRKVSLRLSAGRTELSTDDLFLYFGPMVDPPTNQKWEMKVWRYSLSAQVQKPLNQGGGDLGMLYLYSGIGVVWQELTVDFTLNSVPERLATDETKFLTTIGGGVVAMITPTVGLDFSVGLDVVFIGSTDSDTYYYSYYGNTQTALLLDAKLGIVKLFP